MGNRGRQGWSMEDRHCRRVCMGGQERESSDMVRTVVRKQEDLGQDCELETIANGQGGNSTGHWSADHMLIGAPAAECPILKALRSDKHIVRGFTVQTGILEGKYLKIKRSFFRVLSDNLQALLDKKKSNRSSQSSSDVLILQLVSGDKDRNKTCGKMCSIMIQAYNNYIYFTFRMEEETHERKK